ncbi:Putative uncharacterized protein [Moritella viscosa]|uniref:Uncharacterized protein n=1 Tax=Moritella viscosa TaxID=80854 RepID=A0A1L0AQZ7_9GAMM|nr:Putative uncharacterized protein [Moritella viscosa]
MGAVALRVIFLSEIVELSICTFNLKLTVVSWPRRAGDVEHAV